MPDETPVNKITIGGIVNTILVAAVIALAGWVLTQSTDMATVKAEQNAIRNQWLVEKQMLVTRIDEIHKRTTEGTADRFTRADGNRMHARLDKVFELAIRLDERFKSRHEQ